MLTNDVILSTENRNKKSKPCKDRYDFKNCFLKKANRQPVTAKPQLKNKSTKTCGMKLKTANEKSTKPAATKKGRSFNLLSNPTATKKQQTKKQKEVTTANQKLFLKKQRAALSARNLTAKTNAVTKPVAN